MQIRYYWYSKTVINKVVRHTIEAEPITEWLYMQKEPTDSGNVQAKFYAYYSSINNGIFLTSRTIWDNDCSFIPSMQTECECFSSPEKYMEHLDWCVANAKWVGNAEIELAMQIDAQKGAEISAYRESYLAKQNAQHEAQRKERIEKEQAANAKLVKEEKVMIDNLLSIMQNGGEWRNENSPISGSSILNVIADQNDFTFPIKFKGWVNKHLRSLTFENGMCKYYSYAKGHKSTTVANYVFGLMEHLKTIATDEEIQYLFGLDKK